MLSIVLMGDALIYVVLPVSAGAFGISIVWVGVLLSANRFVRIVSYGAIARATTACGLRQTTIVACIGGASSTVMYWLFDGGWLLLVARLLWGLSFAGLTLTTLAYAVADRRRAGTRVGLSSAIQQFGSVFALTAGAWIAGQFGPKSAFLFLGLASFLALPFAIALPRERAGPGASRPRCLPKPHALDWLFFAVGFAVDGVFAMTITIILADLVSLEAAILGGGIVLSLRRVGDAVFAPIGGWLGDRLGTEAALFAATTLTLGGLAAIALGGVYAGAGAVIVGRAAIAALGPATVAVRSPSEHLMHRMATMQTWRDFGAALGPLLSGFFLAGFAISAIYLALVLILATALLVQLFRRVYPDRTCTDRSDG
ncbi:MAG: MFS transporter [Gammaproteobacteria bacterium]|nr:MFS transporter [Gammaproteobacteria bacterium]